ncbi:MAG: hypothetical protein M1818_008275 [Claussenomyces sp. TS43310]|nr:MAG: hypothetical protein M1818_008275 [Claussenomyces sp. TS43310]
MSASQVIKSPSTLKQLKIPGLTAFVVRWAPHYSYALSTTRIIEQTSHPLHESVKRRWAARKDPLWWYCVTSIREGGNRKVTRGWLNRRSTVAITLALNRKGYDKTGNRIAGDRFGGENLKGSAMVMVLSSALHLKSEALSRQADMVIAHLEKAQRPKSQVYSAKLATEERSMR